ncbi:Chorion peroxidase [Nymphon striatum]|nr:Chorion peroxidase [Nymphon striatum]KAG1662930.1 Chorion peroxidase [Nymphon striatum]
MNLNIALETILPADYDAKTGKPKQIKCCVPKEDEFFEDCFPIRFSSDWFYTRQGIHCLEFTRSAPAFNHRHGVYTFGERQQMNQVTSFIDGSHIYGSSRKVRDAISDFKTGFIRTSEIHKENYLMQDSKAHCESQDSNSCFKAGDHRVNTQLNLMMMHTLFMREHNRIAAYFRNHTKWNGKKVFEETRRIIGAILQHITYTEYLPAILNPKILQLYGLDIANKKTSYKSDVDPSIFNEFSTAAFRFGHSQIYRKLLMTAPDGTPGDRVRLTDSFFNPDQIYSDSARMRQYILGLFAQRSLAADNEVTSAVSKELFKKKGAKSGLDLIAINIQRGRDHGIPPYKKYRELLKGSTDLTDVMSVVIPEILPSTPEGPASLNNSTSSEDGTTTGTARTYKLQSIDHVDLFVGGLYERPLDNSAIGDTFNHLIASQFRNLMIGDRYFYSHENTGDAGFNQDQYEEITKISLASLTCQNVDVPYYTRLQTHGCLQSCPSYMTSCADIPEMNLKVFLTH